MPEYEYQGNPFDTYESVRGRLAANDWERAAVHRQRVMALLLSEAEERPHASLSIWGPGICNDIDLARLSAAFTQVRLVDLEAELLEQGVARQGATDLPQIQRLPGVDLSGVYDLLEQYLEAPSDPLLDRVLETSSSYRPPQLAGDDVIASTCLVSQIIQTAVRCVGEKNARFAEIVVALRNAHLQLMLDCLQPGGTAWLITDVVSSETLPQIADPVQDLPGLLKSAIAEHNHFHAVNPFAIRQFLDTDPTCQNVLASIGFFGPWVWDASNRHYVCVAFRMKKLDQLSDSPAGG